jgi:hypothetical protein
MPGTVAMRMRLSPLSLKMARFAIPIPYPGIGGEELAAFVKRVWTGFPDFHIELNAGEIERGLVALSLVD